MKGFQRIGIFFFIWSLLIFTLMLGLGRHELSSERILFDNEVHSKAIHKALSESENYGEKVNNFVFNQELNKAIKSAQSSLNESYDPSIHKSEWDYKLGDWKVGEYTKQAASKSASGIVSQHPLWFLFLTFGLGILGGLLYILPKFTGHPGIKHDHIFRRSISTGISRKGTYILSALALIGFLIYGYFYMGSNWFWPGITLALALIIIYMVRSQKAGRGEISSSLVRGLGILAGIYFILFYILLYWAPQYITPWITMVNPLSKLLSGNEASQWFLYGLMYTVIVLVMGVRMLAKYRHNRYQRIRTYSVMFFQTAFAFLIPEILVRLNQPWYDFKNIWPLDYDFFFDYNLNQLTSSGGLGIFMLVWGIILIIIGVPVFTYFFGKRWYCSWVCGCGGLAETMGDPFRQLSDKSLKAWKYERYIIHGVLAFAIVMTLGVLYSYFSGKSHLMGIDTNSMRTWYGFFIGSAFSGVVGTGFYPLMGNRVWCRFGCPLAAYLGIVQRFKSRFRITTNGGQCISCGNCSTYCEMGIDVRHYAQRGQDIVRASCVGCGVCAAVCPRGVLKLENGSSDIANRADDLRVIHVSESEIGIL